MADLIAQGSEDKDRWRRTLPAGTMCILGRTSGAWSIPWDDRISRRHVEMVWKNACLKVEKLPDARNPVFFRGRAASHFTVKPGEHFVIGGTTFTLADERVSVTLDAPAPLSEQTFSALDLRQLRFRNADQRIAVLSRLPEIVSGSSNDIEMLVRLVNVLLAGIPTAAAAAVVAVRGDPAGTAPIEVLHWDRRLLSGEDFRTSERLIRRAVQCGQSVVHSWSGASDANRTAFTLSDNADWAFCTPLHGDACKGWAIYVTGCSAVGELAGAVGGSGPQDVRDDLKFAELAATTLSNLREVQLLERDRTSLKQFLSPVVLEALVGQDPNEVLAPREAEVSVMFCDLRGFSRRSEQSGGDLLELLQRVSRSLGVMTHHILEQGGVVGDFHGDAAMGFWGWPLPQEDAVTRACRAALGIRAEFQASAQQDDDPLVDFRMGIGIAKGRAVAGKIGTVDQVKVTVFGPVVNLASRLEGMTKILRAAILLDEPTARVIRALVPRDVARVRRVARVRPYGLQASLEVSELLPPESQYPQLSDEHVAAYEAALDALLSRDWSRAFQLLHCVPAEDRVKDFLTVFIAQHNRTPPNNWDGVIPLLSK